MEMTAVKWLVLFLALVDVGIIGVMAFAIWWRKRLYAWVCQEQSYLRQESEDLALRYKVLVQQVEWGHKHNGIWPDLAVKQYDHRILEFRKRQARLTEVCARMAKPLPW